VELGGPQDLVGVGVPDPSDELIVHQQIPELAPRGLRPLRELVRAPGERARLLTLTGVLRHVGVARAGRQQVDLPHPRVVAIAQVDVAEGQRERRGGADLCLWRQEVEQARQHRVDDQARPVIEGERQEAPAMRHLGERAPGQRFVERLRGTQHQGIVDAHRGHLLPDDGLRDAALQDVEVRPLGHP